MICIKNNSVTVLNHIIDKTIADSRPDQSTLSFWTNFMQMIQVTTNQTVYIALKSALINVGYSLLL